MTFLKGYLTYILAAVAIAWGLVGALIGWIDWATALPIIWSGLAVFGIRRALR